MKVEKYDALGNEFFVIVGGKRPSIALTRGLCSGKASCNAQQNVTADGVIHLTHSVDTTWEMAVLNCDGSDGGFSGNGLRCAFVALESETTDPAEKTTEFVIQTQTNQASGTVIPDAEDNTQYTVKTALSLNKEDALLTIMPHIHSDIVSKLPELSIENVSQVDIGNPHLIIRLTANSRLPNPKEDTILDLLRQSGTIVSGGINVSVIQKQDTGETEKNEFWEIITYERGVGRTKSCGSAAIAAFISLSPPNKNQPPTCFSSKGGTLIVEQSQGQILITGKVKKSFSADYDMGNNRLTIEIT